MKQRVFAWILALMLALTPVLAVAEGDEPEPTASSEPSSPSTQPTATESAEPSASPSEEPPASPTVQPTASPTAEPTASPTAAPTALPTAQPTAAPATPEPTEESSDPLKIDTYWKYPGMDKSYAGGYMPVQANGSVQFIMPLLGKTQGNTIRVVPEFPSDGPFAPSNLQFDVYEKTYDVTQGKDNKTGKMDAYLIQFNAPLKSTYYNGTYTVTLHVTYKTPAGEPAEQTFNMQVQISGGKTPSSGGGGGGQAAVRKPVILIDACTISPTVVSGGDTVSFRLSLKNVGNREAKNIRISAVPESDALTLKSDLNAQFLDKLLVNVVFDADFVLSVAPGAQEGDIVVQTVVTYEDAYGGAYTEEGKYRIRVTQPKVEIVSCVYNEVVSGGEDFTVTLTIQNTGTRDAKNVVVRYTSEDEAIRKKGIQDSVTIGTLKKGESTTVTFDLRALPSASEGRHAVDFLCTYADTASTGTYSDSTHYELTVYQKASIGYDEIKLPESITSGETFVLPICVFNTGFSPLYNVRGVLSVDGLICSSAYLGNIKPQDSVVKDLSIFVTTLSGSSKYGDTWGNFQLYYEDENGEQQSIWQDLTCTINEPQKQTDEEKLKQEQEQKEQQTLSQWWISLLVAIAVIIILIAVILIARFARILRMK
ncbi:MAG: DUF11 domain-containing protein [Clostridia bacterium]|nr:DUF11 domain-containing protein [Clostridia bacterium]